MCFMYVFSFLNLTSTGKKPGSSDVHVLCKTITIITPHVRDFDLPKEKKLW